MHDSDFYAPDPHILFDTAPRDLGQQAYTVPSTSPRVLVRHEKTHRPWQSGSHDLAMEQAKSMSLAEQNAYFRQVIVNQREEFAATTKVLLNIVKYATGAAVLLVLGAFITVGIVVTRPLPPRPLPPPQQQQQSPPAGGVNGHP